MRSILLIRCLPKMSPSSSTSTGSQIATWRRSLTWTHTHHDFSHDLWPLWTGKVFVWSPAFLSEHGSARYSSAPSITTVSLTIRLHITTSLKSISQIRWLYHHSVQRCFHQFNFLNANHVTNHSSFSLVNRLQLIYTVKVGHKYVNVHRHCCWSPVKSIMYDRWQWLSFDAKLARNK